MRSGERAAYRMLQLDDEEMALMDPTQASRAEVRAYAEGAADTARRAAEKLRAAGHRECARIVADTPAGAWGSGTRTYLLDESEAAVIDWLRLRRTTTKETTA